MRLLTVDWKHHYETQIPIRLKHLQTWYKHPVCIILGIYTFASVTYCFWQSKLNELRTSLVVQWLRIHLSVQGMQVQYLFREDSTSHGASKPMCCSYWSLLSGAWESQLLSPCSHRVTKTQDSKKKWIKTVILLPLTTLWLTGAQLDGSSADHCWVCHATIVASDWGWHIHVAFFAFLAPWRRCL